MDPVRTACMEYSLFISFKKPFKPAYIITQDVKLKSLCKIKTKKETNNNFKYTYIKKICIKCL